MNGVEEGKDRKGMILSISLFKLGGTLAYYFTLE
jgi:hypothetical protein